MELQSDGDIQAGGIPIIADGSTAYIDTGDSHTAIAAVSGMKKSICAFMPLIYMLARANEAMVITDPKGELFRRTSGYLSHRGYNVRCLDFRSMNKDGYNILEYPARVYRSGDTDRGLMLASDVVNVFAEKQRSTGHCDVFWPDTAAMYMSGTAAIMFDCYPDISSINISNWMDFNTDSAADTLKDMLKRIPTDNTAVVNLQAVLAEPEKTLLSTLSTASSFLSGFVQNNRLARMLSHSTFDMEELCSGKTALYIITDDTTTTCDSVVGIILTQIQSYLISKAYLSPNERLDRRVNFVLDEFASYPIPEVETALATQRSRDVRYYLCLQSIAGIKRYYKHYESLLANCGSLLFLGSTEKELLERVSSQCGSTTLTPDGRQQPMISAAELMTLEKSWDYKQAVYLNLSESVRYCTMLPSIENYNLGSYAPPELNTVHPRVRSYTLHKLLRDVSINKAALPFTKK